MNYFLIYRKKCSVLPDGLFIAKFKMIWSLIVAIVEENLYYSKYISDPKLCNNYFNLSQNIEKEEKN